MFSSLMSLWSGQSSHGRRSPSRKHSARRLKLERLEGRRLFAVLPDTEILVNSSSSSDQSQVATASAADGRSVVVWTHTASSSNTDIRAQRFNAAGAKVGGEISVASSTRRENMPDVAMRSDGSFAVSWVEQVTSSNKDVKALRFTSNGAPTGSVINVASTSKNENVPSIAMSATGTFVVAWMREVGFNKADVYANRYNSAGVLQNNLAVAVTSLNEINPDVAMSPDGRFAIGYTTSTDSGDVLLKRYSNTAAPVATHTVAGGAARQLNPRVSMDDNANVMVVWSELVVSSDDIKARRISSGGSVGGLITVASTSNVDEITPDVAYKRNGTAFVVTYVNRSNNTPRAVELTNTGTVRHHSTIANQAATSNRVAAVFGVGSSYRLAYSRRASGLDVFQTSGLLS